MDSLEVATFCAKTAAEKRARDVLVLDIRNVLGVADYFVLATARNKRQVKAIANAVRVGLKEHGVQGLSSEGVGTERWVLLDYADVVVHLFDPEARAYYDLESLWADARRVPVDLPESGPDEPEEEDPMDEFAELAGAPEDAEEELSFEVDEDWVDDEDLEDDESEDDFDDDLPDEDSPDEDSSDDDSSDDEDDDSSGDDAEDHRSQGLRS